MDTMIAAHEGGIAVGRIPIDDWQSAVTAHHEGTLADGDGSRRLTWRAAGLLTDEGPADDWARALDLAGSAPVGLTLVARSGSVAFLTNAFVSRGEGRLATVTQRVRTGGPDGDQVVATDPAAEVALATTSKEWTALARVLPPAAEFRTAPSPTPDPVRVQVPAGPGSAADAESSSDASRTSRQVPSLPPGLRALVTDEALDYLFVWGANTAGSAQERVWFLADGQLHRCTPTTGEVWQVRPGDVGAGLDEMVTQLSR